MHTPPAECHAVTAYVCMLSVVAQEHHGNLDSRLRRSKLVELPMRQAVSLVLLLQDSQQPPSALWQLLPLLFSAARQELQLLQGEI